MTIDGRAWGPGWVHGAWKYQALRSYKFILDVMSECLFPHEEGTGSLTESNAACMHITPSKARRPDAVRRCKHGLALGRTIWSDFGGPADAVDWTCRWILSHVVDL